MKQRPEIFSNLFHVQKSLLKQKVSNTLARFCIQCKLTIMFQTLPIFIDVLPTYVIPLRRVSNVFS